MLFIFDNLLLLLYGGEVKSMIDLVLVKQDVRAVRGMGQGF